MNLVTDSELLESVMVITDDDGSGGDERWREKEDMTNIPEPLPCLNIRWQMGNSTAHP